MSKMDGDQMFREILTSMGVTSFDPLVTMALNEYARRECCEKLMVFLFYVADVFGNFLLRVSIRDCLRCEGLLCACQENSELSRCVFVTV
jgi:hypothetical protein